MSKHRYRVLSCVLAALAVAACGTAQDERQAAVSQRLDTAPDAGDGGTNPNACTHAICATGGPLVATCDTCSTKLCAQDPYCCQVTWDATCVGEVSSICGQSCTPAPVDAGGPSSCVHAICATGGPLDAPCDSCATKLCAQDPYCCSVTWDATCVGEVKSICAQACQ